ncbi:uncharacterized protein LOC127280337 [Leptopilina boulardi]|uniref:uncharacterized protein LOC127280337 n=1 Tax=Leptopilina boulardi TaxID=63433 RepID=UPI0021F615E9|nr:uncharacterized protein LOC127280337 [Leptopilina boulardi]XP_051159217.1 uncharacterized protein LOC127280337 [Leptopilina boulardi]
MDTFKNPLETVQLIPIFSYLNILSDFLFIENYLSEIDQNKQIPIINALYKYLQDYEENEFKKAQLIRELLKGSDLYGEKYEEYVDVTFVTVMFEHIISSLVFHKYGNIYGFLANIFREAENPQIEEVLNRIILDLENASFENECGDSSTLSFLAVGRIYNDIILPLFPVPNTNLSLLSIDYIYAQAGSMFLRAGRINPNNYIKFENNVANPTEDNLFDQYLITGQVIEKLILTDEKNFEMLKAFALPALIYYIFNSEYLFDYENMVNLITKSNFWQAAYTNLFEYTTQAFNDINVKLKNDYTLKMHLALSSFQSKVALAKTFMNKHCSHLDKKERDLGFSFYWHYPKSFYCEIDKRLPDPNEYFKNQLNSLIELYRRFNFQLVQEAFPNSLIEKLGNMTVIIKLLLPLNTTAHSDFEEPQNLSYDVLEFYFPNNNTSFEYYILKQEDYSVILTKYSDNENVFTEDIRLYIEKLLSAATPIILKRTDENITVFFQNLLNYKKSRFESHFKMLDNSQGENKEMKSDWWKEFGLSLVPYYPCLSDTLGNNYTHICASYNTVFFYKSSIDISSKAIHTNSRSFLSSLGTNIKSVFLKIASSETVDEIITNRQTYKLSITNLLGKNKLLEEICLHIKDPAFQLTFITKDNIKAFEKIINSLREKINFSFTSVINSLSKISALKSSLYKTVGMTDEKNSRLIFINTLNNQSGYGYKFIFISDDVSKIAQLRTGYEFKDKRFLAQGDIEKEMKMFIALNNGSFKPDYVMYEINNQLWRSSKKLLFSGIPIQPDDYDEKCNNDISYFEKSKLNNLCRRQRRFSDKSVYEVEAVTFIKNYARVPDERIRNVLGKFTFPDKATLMRFVNYWLKNNSFEEPIWSGNYIIDNPDLLRKLRYGSRFEEHNISNFDGEFRINALYSKEERHQIEKEASIENIIKNYNEQKAKYSVTFHDYYAIRNYVTTGYTRITRDTQEAKLMKIALYKLAIRQSDDPDEEFDSKLFRMESKPSAIHRNLLSQNYITLQKFTQAYSSQTSAIRFAGYPAPEFINILYEMKFIGSYARAKIEQFYNIKEKNVILLPGSVFLIEGHEIVNIKELGKVLKLKLKFRHTINEKYVWLINIMNKIARISL